jgi:hypothetical protein
MRLLNDPRIFATPKLVLSVAPRFAEIARFYRRRVVDQALSAIRKLHRKGVSDGVFRDVDSDAVGRLVMGPLLIHAMRRHVLGAEDDAPPDTIAKAHLEILFEGLVIK